jgi:hypothetical protein
MVSVPFSLSDGRVVVVVVVVVVVGTLIVGYEPHIQE